MKYLILILLIAVGCSSPTRAPIVPCEGNIKFQNGKTLPENTKLLFNPALGGMKSAFGETDSDGNFSLTHASGVDGAEIGGYTVSLRSPDGDPDFYNRVPARYVDDYIVVNIEEDVDLTIVLGK